MGRGGGGRGWGGGFEVGWISCLELPQRRCEAPQWTHTCFGIVIPQEWAGGCPRAASIVGGGVVLKSDLNSGWGVPESDKVGAGRGCGERWRAGEGGDMSPRPVGKRDQWGNETSGEMRPGWGVDAGEVHVPEAAQRGRSSEVIRGHQRSSEVHVPEAARRGTLAAPRRPDARTQK